MSPGIGSEGKDVARVAVVTGGAKGIGKVLAEAVAKSGWDVVLAGRDERALSSFASALEHESGRSVRWVALDLARPGAAARLLEVARADGSLPDALVCNAGDYGVLGPLAQVDFAAWKASFDLNFFASAELVARYVEAALASPAASRRRKIVVIGGSGLGGARVWPAISAYACGKAALYRLVEVVHEEVSARGIDINCLAPGAVSTGITQQAIAAGEAAVGSLYRASLDVRDGRGDSPHFVADAIAALLDPACDGLSGRLISAKWDADHLAHPAAVRADPDLLRLRRIDDALYTRKPRE
ncbi:MAG TPA: SDR family NAD(P)-dependent oxidoreductase [Polyangiaceae bacterium]|jgi:short-subunit dehydrogenase|nr:SDR family NAD(P)-dependent oxidoreductase [Polyangiaceae bacterium]